MIFKDQIFIPKIPGANHSTYKVKSSDPFFPNSGLLIFLPDWSAYDSHPPRTTPRRVNLGWHYAKCILYTGFSRLPYWWIYFCRAWHESTSGCTIQGCKCLSGFPVVSGFLPGGIPWAGPGNTLKGDFRVATGDRRTGVPSLCPLQTTSWLPAQLPRTSPHHPRKERLYSGPTCLTKLLPRF